MGAASDPLAGQLGRILRLDWSDPAPFLDLSHLLSLRAIDRLSVGATDVFVRVAALRELLREVADRFEERSTNDLRRPERPLAPAVRLLLDLADDSERLSVADRQQAVAERWGVASESFRTHMQSRVLVAVAAELRALSGDDGTTLGPTSSAGQIVNEALRGFYVDASNVLTLTNTVVSTKPHYADVNVELILKDDPNDPGGYLLDYRMGFETAVREYVVGFVERATLCDAIMAEAPRVHDVWTFSDRASLERFAQELVRADSTVRVIGRSDSGATRFESLHPVPIDAQEYAHYLGKIDPRLYSEVHLFRAPVPGLASPVRFATQYQFHMRKSDHYCYWVADRPMYLRQLTFNASDFCAGADITLTPQPVLGVSAIEAERDGRSFRFPIENWVVSGQGAILVWA
jgi:hypothetical protein